MSLKYTELSSLNIQNPFVSQKGIDSSHYGSSSDASEIILHGSTISTHNIGYSVEIKTKIFCGTSTKKDILKGICCVFKPGMNAILGPTGSGKTTLLDVLAGRKDPSGLEGDVLIDGNPLPHNFKCMVGYVIQDDVIMGTLSVRENLHFSAALRLPESVTKQEREAKVNSIIQELGLIHCADTKCGTEFIRGISGGERKRTSIGIEMILSPPVLYLDEPTTGLDASTANSVMLLLKGLAQKGRTIVFSIHQPRYSIYRLFDNLTLLSRGKSVYHGPCAESIDYFKTIGFEIEEHDNPTEFFLDIINGDRFGSVNNGKDVIHEKLTESFRNSSLYERLQSVVLPIHKSFEESKQIGPIKKLPSIQYATSFLTQIQVVSGRTIKNLIRKPDASIILILSWISFSVVAGAIYWQIDTDCATGIQNRIGAFFLIITNLLFSNVTAVILFIKDRPIFMHENVSGFYRVSVYFFSKTVCDVLPMRLVPITICAFITYFMIGFKMEVSKFIFYLIILLLVTISASGFSFFSSSSFESYTVANLVCTMSFLSMTVFGGLLVQVNSIPPFLRWLEWLSISRYAMKALCINELKDMEFTDTTGAVCGNGNTYLQSQGINYETDWDFYFNFIALLFITFGMLFLAYIQLRRMKKLK